MLNTLIPTTASSGIPKSTILIVDDQPGNLDVLSTQLKAYGFTVLVATKGQNALKRARFTHPDLILLDVMMPDMDGFEVCQRLKADPATRDIPILFITLLGETMDKLKGFAAGGLDYITKPFQAEEVLARINAHLMIRRLHRQLQHEYDRFRSLTEATFEGLIIHDGERIIEVNQVVSTLFGYQREALLGRTVLTLFAPSAHPAVLAQLQPNIPNSQFTIHHSQFSAEELSMANGELVIVNAEVQGLRQDGQPVVVEMQTRPLDWMEQMLRITVLRDVTWRRRLETEVHALRVTLDERDRLGELVGQSPAMHKVYDRLISAAASDETVMIYGETGTGKELAARILFTLSENHTARFVTVNCGSIPKELFESHFFGHCRGAFTGADRRKTGYFEEAEGGTLFLDEIGELPLAMQTSLLRVLNDGAYTPVGDTTERTADVRVIAATNKNLRELVAQNKVREDFFHRLHVIALEMPPLRLHKEDLPLLIRHFLAQHTPPGATLPVIPPELLERFLTYDWPGNVRELYNELRRYLATGEVELGGVRSLQQVLDWREMPFLQEDQSLTEALNAFERFFISRALKTAQGEKTRASAKLGVSRKTLYEKLEKLGL